MNLIRYYLLSEKNKESNEYIDKWWKNIKENR